MFFALGPELIKKKIAAAGLSWLIMIWQHDVWIAKQTWHQSFARFLATSDQIHLPQEYHLVESWVENRNMVHKSIWSNSSSLDPDLLSSSGALSAIQRRPIANCVLATVANRNRTNMQLENKLDTDLTTKLLGIRFRWPFLKSDCTTIFTPHCCLQSFSFDWFWDRLNWGSILHLLVLSVSGIEICLYPRSQDDDRKLRS